MASRPTTIFQPGPSPADPTEIQASIIVLLGVGLVALVILCFIAFGYGAPVVLTVAAVGVFTLLTIGGLGWWEYLEAKGGGVWRAARVARVGGRENRPSGRRPRTVTYFHGACGYLVAAEE
jgi:hypothetical protein